MALTVFAIFTCGTDYYDREELDSLYASEEDAERHAANLRLMIDVVDVQLAVGEPRFASVRIRPQTVR
jgi:hypothetical protein